MTLPGSTQQWKHYADRCEQVLAYLRLRGGQITGSRLTNQVGWACGLEHSGALTVLQRMEADGQIVRRIRGGRTIRIALPETVVPATTAGRIAIRIPATGERRTIPASQLQAELEAASPQTVNVERHLQPV